jgi:hypothetical protein
MGNDYDSRKIASFNDHEINKLVHLHTLVLSSNYVDECVLMALRLPLLRKLSIVDKDIVSKTQKIKKVLNL